MPSEAPAFHGSGLRVPFVDLTRVTALVKDAALAEWSTTLTSACFLGGPSVPAFEEELARSVGATNVAACANGTDALWAALRAAGVRPGSKVALPNLTFWATFEAVVGAGAVPVLVDVDADDLQMSLRELASAYDAHGLDAAVLVHLFGWTSARLPELRAFCASRGVSLVEDAAQAVGVEAFGRPLLAGAERAALSFYPAKVLGGPMDGGAVVTSRRTEDDLVRSLCNHGRTAHHRHAHVGINSRMSELGAAYLGRLLGHLPAILASRRATAAWYRERLASVPRVKVHGPPPGVIENGYVSVVTVAGRSGASLAEALAAAGIETGRAYPSTLDAQPPARASGAILHGDLRVSRAFCEAVVNLPLFYGMREDEREAVASALLATCA